MSGQGSPLTCGFCNTKGHTKASCTDYKDAVQRYGIEEAKAMYESRVQRNKYAKKKEREKALKDMLLVVNSHKTEKPSNDSADGATMAALQEKVCMLECQIKALIEMVTEITKTEEEDDTDLTGVFDKLSI